MKTNTISNNVYELLVFLQDLNKKDPKECNVILNLLHDYHIEASTEELVFWNKFLEEWNKTIN